MKQFVLVLTLVLIASAETVKPTTDTICACDQIKSEADCQNMFICAWTAAVSAKATTTAGSCGTRTILTTPSATSAHCSQVKEPAINCWQTLGCAYVDNKCTHFTGCTAYVKATNFDCQAISKLCITDGTQCTDAKSCNEYTLESKCTTNASISGNFKCKWDKNECRDYFCTEADTTLVTNTQCDAWLSGCVTTGRGCIDILGACASYTGDVVSCSVFKGTDGNCEGTPGETNCTPRVCGKAAITLVTDADCSKYQGGCITNGKGCLAPPLPVCATYYGDNTTCVGYKGSDGICEGDVGASNCRARNCTNAPSSNNTDALCNDYKPGCVTIGKGCATSKSKCSSYSGTTTSCIGFIGSDGKCHGNYTTISSPCFANVCSDAPTYTSTDQACASYQTGCKTTGKGCISTLGPCSSYQGTITTCEGYIGSDGKCKGVLANTIRPCTPKKCMEAPSALTTNEECDFYQTGCLTTQTGCVGQDNCLNTIKQITCTGTPGCGWNNICVANQNCTDFLTVSICTRNYATGGIPCFWNGSSCRNLSCTDAPLTYNSDSLCNAFLTGCLTKGTGCLAPTDPCSLYAGTRTTCDAFTKRCWNAEITAPTVPCTERLCSDDIYSTTDSACHLFKSGCKTKGTGCIEAEKNCSEYTGTQQECEKFTGNSGVNPCWNISETVSSSCINRTCYHKTSAISDSVCDIFLNGCLYNGVGCTERANPCISYTGTQSQCGSFKGNNQTVQCWSSNQNSGPCIPKICEQAQSTVNTDTDCQFFLAGCLTTGAGCISKTQPCSAYTGSRTKCETFTGNSKQCSSKDFCAERLCADKSSGVLNNLECTTYLSTCRYFNGGCVNAGMCTSYVGDSLAKCENVEDNTPTTPKKCWWKTSLSSCIARTCADAPSVSSDKGCTDYLNTCVFNGSICLDQGSCDSYIAFGEGDTGKQSNCGKMKSSVTSKYCWFVSGSICVDRTCDNAFSPNGQQSCETHIGDNSSCQWNGTECQATTSCSSYNVSVEDKLTICQIIKDNSPTPVACFFFSGNNCVSKSCENAPKPQSETSCYAHLSGKCAWNGTDCVNLGTCISYKPSGTDSQKKNICQALSNNAETPQKCTFIAGMSTCTDKTCSNIPYANSNTDCSQWLDTCQWNGKFCETTKACTGYTPFGASDIERKSVCSGLKDTTNPQLQCGFSGTSPTHCSPRVCSTVLTPSQLSDCTSFHKDCRWSGLGSCEMAVNNCNQYTVVAATGAVQCAALTSITGVRCKYGGSGTNCVNAPCEDQTNAQNVQDCTAQGPTCRYTGANTCVTAVACSAYTITASTGFDTICNNLTDNAGTPAKCTSTLGAAPCKARAACNTYAGTTESICSKLLDTNGNICRWNTGSSCDSYKCSEKINANKASDCTTFGANCRYIGTSTCSVYGACASYIVTSTNGPAICNNIKDNSSPLKQCTYLQATSETSCSDAKSCASSFTGLNDTTGPTACLTVIDDNSANQIYSKRCKFITGAGKTACENGICTDKTNAANAADCAGCRYVGVPICQEVQANCTLYNVSTLSESNKSEICNALSTQNGLYCTYVSSTTDTCVARDCTNIIVSTSDVQCKAWLSTCTYTGNHCIDQQATCENYNLTGSDNTAKRRHCSNVVATTGQVNCGFTDGAAACEAKSCNNGGPLTSHTACNTWLNTCTYNGTSCVETVGACAYALSVFTNLPNDMAKYDSCRAIKDSAGNQCDIVLPKCQARTCTNITPDPTSQTDCTNWKSSCRFTGDTCVNSIVACTYTLTGPYAGGSKTDDEKKSLCRSLEATSSTPKVYCTAPAIIANACIARTCENFEPNPPTKDQDCKDWLYTCTLRGNTCITASTCESYSLNGNDESNGPECRLLKDNSGNLCGYVTGTGQTVCINRACNNAPTPTLDTDCSNYLPDCTISNAAIPVCISKSSPCSAFTGLPNQCQSSTGNGVKCWSGPGASTSTPAFCKDKACTDNTTATTNDECIYFKPGCKTNGAGCVQNSDACNTFKGNISTCATFKSTDNINFCKVGFAEVKPCNDKACSDDASSTTDAQCKQFMLTCLTKGKGCIDSTEPCTKYQGTQSICQNFVGAGKKCWNPSTVTVETTFCVDKKCSDDETSTTDKACDQQGCVTKGTGCIEKTAACGSYYGTQQVCSAFKGSNGTKLCWNTANATSTTPCTERVCSDNTTATSDADCETFLPRAPEATEPKCVTSGAGCVDYPRSCSGFTGTLEQCGKFTATDGPCKTTASGSISASGPCTPRICTDALNSNNTDKLCKDFHPTCVTTGYGCVTSVECSMVQEQNSCVAKTGCSWVNNCRTIYVDCPSLTTFGASICVNTSVSTGSKKCSWYNNACRAQTCDDLSSKLNSHDSCKAIISTCTSRGSGCITMGICSGYATEVICKAAKTTQVGDTCIWDTNVCRTKRCTDAPTGTTTDTGCDTYLTGCKTNGVSCVENITCSILQTYAACQVDELKQPCLFVNNQCYNYAKCEDTVMPTHSTCQQFSPLCTTNGYNCIAISTCGNAVLQVSCVVGTDGTCGWLPANGDNEAKCQRFRACSDAVGTDLASCTAYGNNCITDGVKCVDKSTCSTYLTQISCAFGGTDGVCKFITTSNTCQLRECSDATITNASEGITSHYGCYAFTAKTKCTTNGTTCISLQACASYEVEVGCFEGTDGLCVYDFSMGQTTGTKSCRVKTCGDFKLDTSIACSDALTGVGKGTGCVSDGTNCIVKAACLTYTSKEACNGGGSDGTCVFTPGSTATPDNGTCKLMSTCSDANNDSKACNYKSSACEWLDSNGSTKSACNAHTCATRASGSKCNPVSSLDGKSYTICGPATTGGCTEVSINTLSATTCQQQTLKTYTWDVTTSKCTACFTASSTSTDPVTNIGEVGKTTTDGNLIKLIATLLLLVILVV